MIFNNEFYAMADELGRELDTLAKRHPGLLPTRAMALRVAAAIEVFGDIGISFSDAAKALGQFLMPAFEKLKAPLMDLYEQMQRIELYGRITHRLWFLPDFVLDGPVWWICAHLPGQWLPRLVLTDSMTRPGKRPNKWPERWTMTGDEQYLDCTVCGKELPVNEMYSVDACSEECQSKILEEQEAANLMEDDNGDR